MQCQHVFLLFHPPDPRPVGPAWLDLLLAGSGKLALLHRMLQAGCEGQLRGGEVAVGKKEAAGWRPKGHVALLTALLACTACTGVACRSTTHMPMRACCPCLQKLKAQGHRVLIYSQFLYMLDTLEWYAAAAGHGYLHLDGSVGKTWAAV